VLSRRAVLAGLAAATAGALLPWPLAAQAPIPGRARVAAATPVRNDVVGELLVYSARYEDTLMDVARTYNLGYAELIAANPGVDLWLPGLGARILLPTPTSCRTRRARLVVNLSDQRIYWFPGNGQPVQTFAIGIGQEGWARSNGTTTVVRKKENPTDPDAGEAARGSDAADGGAGRAGQPDGRIRHVSRLAALRSTAPTSRTPSAAG
jgi:L,D-transpeptidase ErfK/SrfK